MSADPVALAATKFTAPHVLPRHVRRPRLIETLDAGVDGPLTLLAAPAGAGKSALLASWVSQRPEHAVAWYSLDAADGERRNFWRGTLEALRRAGVGDPLASLAIHPTEPVDLVLPSLVNALEAVEAPVTLVLDDMHEIEGSPGLADLDRLLRRPPRGLRLVMSTRADPALRLGRLRLAGELTEIRASDLAFTLDETIELLAASGVDVTANVAAQLWQRTEGWAAGLRLAALTMRSHPDPERFVSQFAGDDSTIADYLLAEVLAQQAPDVRDFLLRIAIPDGVSGDLANALTGRSDGGRILAQLERDHALLTSTGGARSWYRLHPLFAELLRSELAYAAADEIPALHARAADWFEARNQPTEAVRHAAAAEDWPRVGALVGTYWVPLLLSGRLQSVSPLLARLPDALVRSRPELAIAVAGSYVDAGSEAHARQWFEIARAGRDQVPAERLDRFDLGIATVGLLRGRLRGDLDAAMRNARAMVDDAGREPIGDEDSRALAFANLGIAELWDRDLDRAGQHLETARAAATAGERDWLIVVCGSYLSVQCVMTGRFDRATRLCDEADALAQRRGWSATWPLGVTALARASIALERGRLDEAERLQARALERLHEANDRPLRGVAAMQAARLFLARGQSGLAGDAVEEAREWLHDWPATAPMRVALDALAATVDGVAGERTRAIATLEGAPTTLEARLALGRLQFRAGEAALALAALGDEDEVPGLYRTRVEARVLTGLAHDALAEHDAAAAALERAMDAAERNGVQRPFLAYGRAIGPLLRRQRRHGTAHRALLEQLIEQVERPAGTTTATAMPQALSEREATVLRFLPTMMSNQEIAAELFVSVNTVKTHLKSIYRKLDVVDRRSAVRRARKLALLGPG